MDNISPHTAIMISSGQLIKLRRLVRLLMNVNPEDFAEELFLKVANREMSFIEFLEEKDGVDRICDALFPNESSTDENSNWSILQEALLFGYEIAEVKMRTTKVDGVLLNER